MLGITAAVSDVLNSQLVATYLHGSLAMGSYYRPKSDVDLLVVIGDSLSDPEWRHLATRLLDAFDERPTTGGLELSVVHRHDVERFEHPLPYESHFSEEWAEDIRRGGVGPRGRDPDLAAHCTATRSHGIALTGDAPTTVLGPVPHEAFVESILDDLRWITVEGGIHESPFYGVLNSCRVLQVLAEGPGILPSKEEGGRWALDELPSEHRTVIDQALECYRSAAAVSAEHRRTHGHEWDHAALRALSAYTTKTAFPGAHR